VRSQSVGCNVWGGAGGQAACCGPSAVGFGRAGLRAARGGPATRCPDRPSPRRLPQHAQDPLPEEGGPGQAGGDPSLADPLERASRVFASRGDRGLLDEQERRIAVGAYDKCGAGGKGAGGEGVWEACCAVRA
jgi:hypothetical protein